MEDSAVRYSSNVPLQETPAWGGGSEERHRQGSPHSPCAPWCRVRCRLSVFAWHFLSTPSFSFLRKVFCCFRNAPESSESSAPRNAATSGTEEHGTLVADSIPPRPDTAPAAPWDVCTPRGVAWKQSGRQSCLFAALSASFLGSFLACVVLYLLCVWRNDWQSIDTTLFAWSGKYWSWAWILCSLFFFVWSYNAVLSVSILLVLRPPPCWTRAAESSTSFPAAMSSSASRLSSACLPVLSPLHYILLPGCLALCAAFFVITFLLWGPEYRGVPLWFEFYFPSLYAVSLPVVTLCFGGVIVFFSPTRSSSPSRGVVFPESSQQRPGCHPHSSAPLLDTAGPAAFPGPPGSAYQPYSHSDLCLFDGQECMFTKTGTARRASAGEADLTAPLTGSGTRDVCSPDSPSAAARGRASGTHSGCLGVSATEEKSEDRAGDGGDREACGEEDSETEGPVTAVHQWRHVVFCLPQWVALLVLAGVWTFFLAAPFVAPWLFSSPCLLRDPPASSPENQRRRVKFSGEEETWKTKSFFAFGSDSSSSLNTHRSKRANLHPWLPEKPLLIGHRGLPELRPENTEVSFEAASAMGCSGLESDVVISADGVPFLLHDLTFARTTNVADVFPSRAKTRADLFTWADVAELNAGRWWLEKDPYGTVKLVDPVVQKEISEQKIPTLEWLMRKAVSANRTLIYDLRCPDCDSNTWGCGTKCVDLTIDLVRKTKCSRHLWWLQDKRQEVKKEFPDVTIVTAADRHFRHDADNLTDVLNVEWVQLDAQLIKMWNERGYWVNAYVVSQPWLLSYFWCAGVDSVTTNSCSRLNAMDAPVQHISWNAFLWYVAILDLICILLFIGLLYFCRRPPSDCPCSVTVVNMSSF
ncbi:glycerophosphodiester phosphodiesterase family protein [Toxoplasma gondii MAS]|uniref:Glycerophosphodiester phosphodiesterase family protein n=1 Tax=Toxoplasma gondii MAS TaxID=943118 RepID=A0A086PVY3_TOXGO|nr:glycerophosphodiester phosphodiesterase family protein [Toxoplasma gondii MAS]